MNAITPAFSNEALWGIIAVMGAVLLLLGGELFYARIQLNSRQERYWWVLGVSTMYMFEYDIAADELLLSDHFAALLGAPRHIYQFSTIMGALPKQMSQRGLGNISRILECCKQDGRLEMRRMDGSMGVFRVRCNSFKDKHGQLCSMVGILVDVTREAQEEEALRTRAERDGLTAVYNSDTVRFRIGKMLEKRTGAVSRGFVMLDVDHFKGINDTLGHQSGDRVLQNLSDSLRTAVRDTDIIGRLGGDEFCIYLPQIPDYEFLCRFCQRLNAVSKSYFNQTEIGIDVTISVGGVLVRPDETFADVYRRADQALYEAKAQGRNTNCVRK